MTRSSENWAYRAGVGVAALTSFLTVWTTIVRDDGSGMMFFELIMAALVGAFATWFRPDGLARTMFGVAVMQVLVGLAIATAPITAQVAGGPTRALVFSAVFAGLWLLSAVFFRAAARARAELSPA
ncbi:MAG: hypothetical protein V4513_05285 [Pseudomonadota bacterium]